jgi:hypothetical protein
MNPQDENRDIVQPDCFNPFPEPQTIPSGWDLSGLYSTPEPAPITEENDSTES